MSEKTLGQIESYTILETDYSMADKMLERLDGLRFKDSQRNSIAEFFAILRAKVVNTGEERLLEAQRQHEAEIERLREALSVIPPNRLRMLADYHDLIDLKYTGHAGKEVQNDLRKMADLIDAALQKPVDKNAGLLALNQGKK